ncbi:bifunctional N-acetylglucosamine-1-phosphate uridyltransferase/glucosamine-1-phosphate acetyltransferase [Rhodococcus sp. 14-2470-1a]|nr:bifunctional N-acetylglucosamine-1-phosphate uridyltransferase/glucosamine-1-phosphate acetyltransferase [Rhodococcus sp. 06-621-2]OZC88101.1 bifunctional N-acetylglucosamine-1-phosphate uridyltransferase/glucosamine-1-phosphate acetyltransferase [Rhodococcus sp. 06-418-1B]OZD73759.1 bifunctional N-acetylglucosamine-1-phosphate uridyltransferase/glucosamine-1-phosphate acetyltransferase [Rhodococcus sp. 06-1059B-a]OZF56543.1 bifunctional N-acetylglucosamine-1-phosphate uridyltransferase/gluco
MVVLAAGAGTRMRSKTPKVLHPLAGRTMLAHALHAAADLGPDHLVTVVGHDRERVTESVLELSEELGRTIVTTVQEQQLGTGHAVQCGLGALPDDFEGTVLVTAADVPLLDGHTLKALLDEHLSAPLPAAATVLTFVPDDANGYGRIVRADDDQVAEIVEHADATPAQVLIDEVNSGVYAFDATALRVALGKLSTANAQHELYLTDVVKISKSSGLPVYGTQLADPDLVMGVNDRVQLAHVTAVLNRHIVEKHMRAGVTVVDPATTWIDIDVTVGADVRLEPGVQLLGSTHVGEDAVIGPDTTLRDVVVGERASVVRTQADKSTIGPGATVGPFAYLRPGSDIGDSAKIGTFVETKNSTVGNHSKVPHLTYVGDATIGEHSNIGASSVFVNYDGVNKSRTVVGSHVRTGSDNMFVAPVRVGDGAYTGAGTVLRNDVPPGTLAVSAGSQRNIEGWVEKKRPGTAAADAAARALAAESANAQKSKDGEQQ